MLTYNKFIPTRILLVFSILVISLPTCNNLLVEDPKDQVFIENFFKTENDAIAAINSIYAVLNSTSFAPTFGGAFHSSYWVMSGLASDEMENRLAGSIELDELDQFRHKPVNGTVRDFWINGYKGISNANFAIAGIQDMKMDEKLKSRLIGEARFLRGLLYFDLVRLFGDIPLMLSITDPVYPKKALTAAIYDQVIADLSFSEKNLPTSYPANNGKGRATSGAAKGLLAKVFLTQKNYAKAITYCKDIISSGQYSLWADFKDAFKIPNTNGKEALFSVGFGTGNNSISFWEVGQFNVRLLPKELTESVANINAQGWQVATKSLLNAYDPLDRRREVTLLTEVSSRSGGKITIEPHIQKYWDKITEPQGGNTENDFPYLRYADILLMYAEALNEQNNGPTTEAYDAINAIRKRARFDGTKERTILPNLSGLNYTQFKERLLNERRLEFVGEGQRWFDLVRFNQLESAVKAAKSKAIPMAFHKLFPIPQEEVDLNNNLLPQNPGY
jgi:hypothetical protein